MGGLFAEWQPAYAEAGIATFPVDAARKKPAVANYLKGGMGASAQWALKFPQIGAIGFACGPRNRITVCDIDEANDNLVADVLAKFGPSPVVIRTASGKYHVWYRHGGEGRKIRARGFAGPVDILGNGFAVAPPSQTASGAYQFICGSLADVGLLPLMGRNHALTGPFPVAAVAEGERNDTLWRACMRVAPDCIDFEMLLARAIVLNSGGLPADEVARTAQSAWKKQQAGCNGFAGAQFVQLKDAEMAVLERHPDAFYVFSLLKRRHWGRDFPIANEWRTRLPGGSMSRPRFVAARNFLLENGLIRLVAREIPGKRAALYSFSSPDAVSRGRQGGGV